MFGAGSHLCEVLLGAYHDVNRVGISPSLRKNLFHQHLLYYSCLWNSGGMCRNVPAKRVEGLSLRSLQSKIICTEDRNRQGKSPDLAPECLKLWEIFPLISGGLGAKAAAVRIRFVCTIASSSAMHNPGGYWWHSSISLWALIQIVFT